MRLNYLYCSKHRLRTQRDFCKDRQKTRSNNLSMYKNISIGILTMLIKTTMDTQRPSPKLSLLVLQEKKSYGKKCYTISLLVVHPHNLAVLAEINRCQGFVRDRKI